MIYEIKRFSQINKDEDNLPASFVQPISLDRGKLRRKLEDLGYSSRESEIILDTLREDPDGEITAWIERNEVSDEIKAKMEETGLDFPAAYIEAKERVERHFSFHSDSEGEVVLGDITLKKSEPGLLGKFLGRISGGIKKSQDNFLFYDIYKGQENIGSVQFDKVSEDEINIPLIEISKKHRGNHYATKVLEWAIKYFKRCGFKELSLEAAGRSPDAIHIYEKLGFKKLKQISEKDIWGGLTEMKLKL